MTQLFANKTVYATLFVLFTLAILVNTLAGGSMPTFGASPLLHSSPIVVADGPIFPPDPWGTTWAKLDGPIFPPDPWGTTWAKLDGPIFPPDPWSAPAQPVNLAFADGPIFPPDPWDDDDDKKDNGPSKLSMAITDGPIFPPDPWDDDDDKKDDGGSKRS